MQRCFAAARTVNCVRKSSLVVDDERARKRGEQVSVVNFL
jgi:hypothetical protein